MLEDALFTRNFRIPNRKYYLVDTGYHNTDYLLCHYYSICYYLKNKQ